MSAGAGVFETTTGRSRWVWLAVDAIALAGFGALLGLVWLPTFGSGWLWVTVLGGTLLGWTIGVLAHRRGLGVGRTAAVTAVAWFALGGMLAMPSTTTAGVFPTGRTLHGLASAPVTAWKSVLQFDPPIGETGNLLCIPLALAIAQGLLACAVSLRSRRPQLAWLPPAAALGFAAWLGTGVGVHPVGVAIGFAVLALVWTTLRLGTLRGLLVRQGGRHSLLSPLMALLVLGLAGAGTWWLAPALEPDRQPATLRDAVSQPLDLRHEPSPLQAFRANLADDRRDTTLFTIAGDLPAGAIIRLATLDEWDGLAYQVTNSGDGGAQTGQFRRVGASVEAPDQGTPVDLTITVDQLAGIWLPTVGNTTSVGFLGSRSLDLRESLFHNRATGTALTTAALQPGDAYRFTGRVVARPSDEKIQAAAPGTAALPAPRQVPDTVGDVARVMRGTATGGDAALKIEKALREGYFSHGLPDQTPSAPGHSAARIQALLQRNQLDPPSMIGDDEQYAVAMALLALDSGVPSRVVYGYRSPGTGGGAVTGAQVGAWTECQLADLGWVAFDPTPPRDRTLDKIPPDNPPAPNKRVDAPPPRAEPPQAPPLDNTLPAEDSKAPRKGIQVPWAALGRWTLTLGIPVVFVLAPLVAVLLAKRRRRRRRLGADLAANRVAGAWAEVVDTARDLGARPSPAATRSEQAEQLVLDHPELARATDPIGLAKAVDHGVFRPEPVSAEEADEVWQGAGGLISSWRQQLPAWRWLRSRFSTRSLRRYR